MTYDPVDEAVDLAELVADRRRPPKSCVPTYVRRPAPCSPAKPWPMTWPDAVWSPKPTTTATRTTRRQTSRPASQRAQHGRRFGRRGRNRCSRWCSAPGCSSPSISCGGGTTLSPWLFQPSLSSRWSSESIWSARPRISQHPHRGRGRHSGDVRLLAPAVDLTALCVPRSRSACRQRRSIR